MGTGNLKPLGNKIGKQIVGQFDANLATTEETSQHRKHERGEHDHRNYRQHNDYPCLKNITE